ncbi:hypothetical protein D3C81_585390 [compost metagenome]
MLKQRFIVSQKAVLNTACGMEITDVGNILVSITYQVIRYFVGAIEVIRNDGVNIRMFVIEVGKDLG